MFFGSIVLSPHPAAAQATLPQVYLDTTLTAPAGKVIPVPSGGDLQAALNSAQPGDAIELQAGATFTGNFTLPNKAGSGWIHIRTSRHAELPAPGTRIKPSNAGLMAKIVTPNSTPAIAAAAGAHHYRFIGIEFTTTTSSTQYGLVNLEASTGQTSLGQVPTDIVLDRCYLHGTPTGNSRRGLVLHSARSAVVDSHFSDFHEVGADSQAIAGWNGPGPYKIVNNYLEGAGENVLFGGADPSIANLVPSDIEIRGNHFFKPLKWKIGDPAYAGIAWSVKNIFELKNARRVLVDGNIFENNWPHAQNGFAILFTVRNQDGTAPWSVVEDVTFTHNIVRNVAAAVNILGRDNNAPSRQTSRILIQNNVFENVGGRLLQVLDGAANIVLEHNTAFQSGETIMASGAATAGLIFRNNIAPTNQYGVAGDGTTGNPMLTLSTYFPGATFARNALVGGNSGSYPADNFFPATFAAVGFTDQAGGDYRLAASSPYKGAGTDGKDLGTDIDALNAATAGAVAGNSTGTPQTPPPPVTPPDPTPEPTTPPVTPPDTTPEPTPPPATSLAPQNVVWSGMVNAAATGNNLKKTAGCNGCQDAGGVSTQTITSGDGYVETTVSEVGTQRVFGLSRPNSDLSVTSIDFAIRLWPDGGLDVRERGVYKTDTRYAVGDVLRIAVESGVVKYYKNGSVFYTSSAQPTYPLLVDTSLMTMNAALSNVRIASGTAVQTPVPPGPAPTPPAPISQNVTWTSLVNVVANGNSIKKTGGCNGCQDAGAVSTQRLDAGNGHMEFTISETGSRRVVGLSRPNSSTNLNSIDYGVGLWPDGGLDIRERGVYRTDARYAVGDVIRIAIESGKVKYYKNGTLIFTSATAPAYPLLVDSTIFTTGGTVGNTTLTSAP